MKQNHRNIKNLIKVFKNFTLFILGLYLIIIRAPRTAVIAQQNNKPTMIASLAWESTLRSPGWTEVLVTLTNEANLWEGELQVADAANKVIYRYPLNLPGHSQKQYRFPLFVSESGRLNISLVESGETILEQRLMVRSFTADKRICMLIDPVGKVNLGASEGCDAAFPLQSLESLPETAMAWDTIDMLVLNGISTKEMTPGQQKALLAWVSAGGRLVIGGGAALPQTLEGLPQSLVGVSLRNFDATTGATQLTPHSDAETTVMNLGTAVIVGHKVGLGTVNTVGVDLNQQTYISRMASLWADDPIPATTVMAFISSGSISTLTPPAYQLLQIPVTSTPKLWQWILLFLLYILLMGPGTWFLIRRLQRPVLAWVMMPIWILIGIAALSLWLNGSFAETFPLVHEMAIVSVPGPGLPARVLQSTAILAPHAGKITWETPGAPRPLLGSYEFDASYYGEGTPYAISVTWDDEDTRVESQEPRGSITWGTEGLSTGPAISFSLALTSNGADSDFTGTISSEVPLQNARLFLNNGTYVIPLTDTIPANVQIPITQPLTATKEANTDYNNLCLPLNTEPTSTYYAYAPYYYSSSPNIEQPSFLTRCYLAATTPGVPFPSQGLGGTQMSETCLLIAVPCPKPQRGSFSDFPAHGRVDSLDKGWIEQDNTVFILPPQTTVGYELPEFLQPHTISAFDLNIQGADYWGNPSAIREIKEVELWSWETETWVSQPLQSTADSQRLHFNREQAGQFFDRAEGLRLRITLNNSTLEAIPLRIDVTADGTW